MEISTERQLLTRKELAKILGISVRTLSRSVAKGILPAPKRTGARSVGWPVKVIEDFLKVEKAE